MQNLFETRKSPHQPLSIECDTCYRGYMGNVIKEDKFRFGGACEMADVLSLSWKLKNLSWKRPRCGQDVQWKHVCMEMG